MIRELNDLEYINYSIGQPYNIVVVLRMKGQLTEELLAIALSKLQQRHPLLKVTVSLNDNNKPVIISDGVGSIPIKVIAFGKDSDTEEEFRKQLVTAFDYHQKAAPLIRVSMLNSQDFSDIVICVQHTFADGLSMFFLARDLIEFLNNPNEEIEVLSIPLSKQDIFPPNVRKMIPKKPIFGNLLFGLLKLYHGLRFGFKKKAEDLQSIVKKKYEGLRVYSWKLSENQTNAFLKKCKQEQVSVHSALCTVFLSDIKLINNPVNLRDRLNYPIGESFGNYVAGGMVKMRYRKRKNFWTNTRKYQRKLYLSLRDRKVFGFQKIFTKALPPSTINKMSRFTVDISENRKSVFLTNLGSLDRLGLIKDTEKFSLISFYGAISNPFGGLIVLVFTLRKEMYFHLHYNHSESEFLEIKQLAKKIEQRILDNI
ncbi:MAG: hypothetical protein FK734_00835 [Asgard group archaeon]|nr:hypothetical protein [Asgard group archaeon]